MENAFPTIMATSRNTRSWSIASTKTHVRDTGARSCAHLVRRSVFILGMVTMLIMGPRPSETWAICGDADGNGVVNTTDGVNVLRKALGLSSACFNADCDADGNGIVDLTDGVNVLRKAVGLSNSCNQGLVGATPTPTPTPKPTATPLPASCNPNGILDGREECDPLAPGDHDRQCWQIGCSAQCGTIDGGIGIPCNGGKINDPTGTWDCTCNPIPVCNNGVTDFNEICDPPGSQCYRKCDSGIGPGSHAIPGVCTSDCKGCNTSATCSDPAFANSACCFHFP